MSNLKCPSCGKELKQDYYDCEMFECHNPKCKHYYDSCIGREELWQELIRTRKALDCAINTLETVYGMSEDASNIETYVKCKRIEINGIIKGYNNE